MSEKLRLGGGGVCWRVQLVGRFRLTSEPSLSSWGVGMMDGRELGDRTHEVSAGMDETALKGFIYLMKLAELMQRILLLLSELSWRHDSRGHEQETI